MKTSPGFIDCLCRKLPVHVWEHQ